MYLAHLYALVVALFDSGSTNMFLAETFVDMISMDVQDLGFDLRVSTPIGVKLTTSTGVQNVVVVI